MAVEPASFSKAEIWQCREESVHQRHHILFQTISTAFAVLLHFLFIVSCPNSSSATEFDIMNRIIQCFLAIWLVSTNSILHSLVLPQLLRPFSYVNYTPEGLHFLFPSLIIVISNLWISTIIEKTYSTVEKERTQKHLVQLTSPYILFIFFWLTHW